MLTLPNILTLSRIFAVPILVFLLWKPTPVDYLVTFVLYCIVGITDYFDGYLARAQQRISRLGQFLDPIADKIMVAAVIVMLIASRRADDAPPILQDLAIIPALVILLREIIVSGLREFLGPLNVSVPDTSAFLLFLVAVMASAWLGGIGPALFATVLAALAGNFFFMEPKWAFGFGSLSQRVEFGLFLAEGIVITLLAGQMHRARNAALADQAEARGLQHQLLRVSDDERRRIGHDLHDGLGQRSAET